MRYLADLLTLTRVILGVIIIVMAFIGGPPELAFILFVVAELTDAFDGTCATKWPFSKDNIPRYRKYAAKFDLIADGLLVVAITAFLTLQINLPVGIAFMCYFLISSSGGDLLVYHRLVGHPDNCTEDCLLKRNFSLAKKIILTRRYIYDICLIAIILIILFTTSWPDSIKYGILIICGLTIIFLWFFLRQRRHNISRDAVDIEQKLAKKAQKR